MFISSALFDHFVKISNDNTNNNIETIGLIFGKEYNYEIICNTLIIPD